MSIGIREKSTTTTTTMELRLEDKYRASARTETTRQRQQTRKSLYYDLTSPATLAHQCPKLTHQVTTTRLCLATLALVLSCALLAATAATGSHSPSHFLGSENANLIAHNRRHRQYRSHSSPPSYHQLTSQDLASADQLDDPTFLSSMGDDGEQPQAVASSRDDNPSDDDDDDEPILVDNFSEFAGSARARRRRGGASAFRPTMTGDESVGQEQRDGQESHDTDRSAFMGDHTSQLRAMRDMFERRQLSAGHHNSNNNHNHHHHRPHRSGSQQQQQQPQLQPNSQELSPISIGLDPPFAMPSPFQMGDGAAPPLAKPQMVSDGNDGGGVGPMGGFPFGANPLPHLLGFQNAGGAFDGPQRGDHSAHSSHHAAAAPGADVDGPAAGPGPGMGAGAKVWPKIFRFTDGRINLSDFEKQKKIRLSSKNPHGENHIESAPIMFDNRQLKRKSFLILHGGVFPSRR